MRYSRPRCWMRDLVVGCFHNDFLACIHVLNMDACNDSRSSIVILLQYVGVHPPHQLTAIVIVFFFANICSQM